MMHFKKTLKKERQVKTMAKKKIGIIGGGISGAGLAYHLSLYEGEADVTVFEKDTIGGASTAKSAGTVCLFDDSLKNRYWDVRLYGFESYLKMEEEEKGSAGFDKTGTLVVATNEEVEKVIKTGIALAKAAGYTGEYITDKDRIKEILPDISTENILGAGYTEDDGYFDGTMISNTYMKKAQKNGVTVKTGVKVTDVKIVDNKVKGLVLENSETGEKEALMINGIFPFIGLDPMTQCAKSLGIVNAEGYIDANENMETAVKGVFVAGDVRSKQLRQVVTATNDGAIAGQYIASLK